MKTIKVSEAAGPALDWLVAKCEGKNITLMRNDDGSLFPRPVWADGLWQLDYSTNWAQGGPIIERQRITIYQSLRNKHKPPIASMYGGQTYNGGHMTTRMEGPTPLIAAMRCYVASKLGATAEVPEELT